MTSNQGQIIIIPENTPTSQQLKEYNKINQTVEEEDSEIDGARSIHQQNNSKSKKYRKCSIIWRLIIVCVIVLALAMTLLYISREDLQKSKNKEPISAEKQSNNLNDHVQEANKKQITNHQEKSTSVKEKSSEKPQEKPKDQSKENSTTNATKTPKGQPVYIPLEIQEIKKDENAHRPTIEHGGHSQLTYSYATLGMRDIGKTFNFTQVNMGDEYYQFEKKIDEIFKPYNDTDCQLERYGDNDDGGYLLCRNFVKQSEGLINLGVEGRDLFGCSLTTEFLIPNYQYDCTNTYAPTCKSNQGMNSFESACLSERTEKANNVMFNSLKDMVDSRNLTGKHVTMKIDIEGAQWAGFRSFPYEYLDHVDQFVLEIHLSSGAYSYSPMWGNLDSLRSISDKFVSVNLHMNNHACIGRGELDQRRRFYPAFAIEVTLVNRNLIKINKPTRSYALHSKNTPNKGGQDCQLRD